MRTRRSATEGLGEAATVSTDLEASRLLARVGLSERLRHLPSQLSGGERQRVALARAIMNSPKLILADEPTGNLDSKTGDEIMALFDELHAKGNTIVVVTHEPDIAEFAHRIISIRDGSVAHDGPSHRVASIHDSR